MMFLAEYRELATRLKNHLRTHWGNPLGWLQRGAEGCVESFMAQEMGIHLTP